ncbi:hypothetical protein CBR_g3845 [Chara braunii]|uniref:Exocyst complex component Sec3 PIP2-binding N-terminal domain-containing protein n=1 Tax=Chara braunii TaxID=69332 RepID=A0A388KGJ5_CHABU|nr:hypothetical protein CBR_g3845 [Chara braunii]|eukprot:GBG69146.1 hypothetical protein CBR_g3845 [Chara braunii]
MTSKPRVLVVTGKKSLTTEKLKVKIHSLKQGTGDGGLQTSKVYKLKHLVRLEAVEADKSGLSFGLIFDTLKTSPPQWSCRSLDDRNRLFVTLRQLSKEHLGRVPSLVGIDLVELALWAQSFAKGWPLRLPAQEAEEKGREGGGTLPLPENALEVVGQHDLVSAQEEKDMEALLGTYLMEIDEADAFSERLKRELSALEAANVHAILESEVLVEAVISGLEDAASSVEDMDEWLHIFNVKLKHVRDDIEMIERRNNILEVQEHNGRGLLEELDKLLNQLHVPPEYASLLVESPFEEPLMPNNIEACQWLVKALIQLSRFDRDPVYAQMRAVREKRSELENLRSTFVCRLREFLQDYFTKIVEFMPEKQYSAIILQKGHLRGRFAHKELRMKFKTYAPLIHHLKELDSFSLQPVRKAYATAMNHLLQREMRDVANELKGGVRAPRSTTSWLHWMENGAAIPGSGSAGDTSAASDAFARMLQVFIPLFSEESRFFATFMCFDASPPIPVKLDGPNGEGAGAALVGSSDKDEDEDYDPIPIPPKPLPGGLDIRPPTPTEKDVRDLNCALESLLAGAESEFTFMVDWAFQIDPLRCIPLLGLTERWISTHGKEPGSFLHRMLRGLEDRIRQKFDKFVDEICHSIEKYDRNLRMSGVVAFIPRFATLAVKMESLIKNNIREAVDGSYNKIVGTMFQVLENIAKVDPKHSDLFLLENYAAFQNMTYKTAEAVPVLGKLYQQASNLYEASCSRYTSSLIELHFGRLFEFMKKVEESLLFQRTPEEIAYQPNLTRADLKKLIKVVLPSPGIEKVPQTMFRKMHKHVPQELLPYLSQKLKDDFLRKYDEFEQLVGKCYPGEVLSPTSSEMRELFKLKSAADSM